MPSGSKFEDIKIEINRINQAAGSVEEALKVYADLQVLLREELGVSPSAASQRVFEGLLRE